MPRDILIKLIKTKHKERILKAARGKQQGTYKGNPTHLTADLSANSAGQKRMSGYIESVEREKFTTKTTVPGKDLIQNCWRNKSFSEKQKLREFSTKKPVVQQILKRFI